MMSEVSAALLTLNALAVTGPTSAGRPPAQLLKHASPTVLCATALHRSWSLGSTDAGDLHVRCRLALMNSAITAVTCRSQHCRSHELLCRVRRSCTGAAQQSDLTAATVSDSSEVSSTPAVLTRGITRQVCYHASAAQLCGCRLARVFDHQLRHVFQRASDSVYGYGLAGRYPDGCVT
jgi:hypothetical protein